MFFTVECERNPNTLQEISAVDRDKEVSFYYQVVIWIYFLEHKMLPNAQLPGYIKSWKNWRIA